MKKEDWKILAILIFIVVGLSFSYYTYCDFLAQRYNDNYGTHFDASDIIMGLHEKVRDIR